MTFFRLLMFLYIALMADRCALARTHISSVEVAAQVWCIMVETKHPFTTKEATALTEALAIHYALTVAANNRTLTRRANKAIGQFLKNEELLKAVCEVSEVLLEALSVVSVILFLFLFLTYYLSSCQE